MTGVHASAVMPEVASAPPQVLVSDLDGTFLSPDGTVSALNAEAVHRAKAAGLSVLFATGRPIRGLGVLAAVAADTEAVVASNGAVLYDLAAEQVLVSHPIPGGLIAAVCADLRAAIDGVEFGFEHGTSFSCTAGYQVRGLLDETITVVTPDDGFDDVVKVLVQQPALDADLLHSLAEPVVGDRLTVTHSSHDGFGLLELSVAGVTKASMIAHWCAERGIPAAAVAAFGDMPNDREMLSWVGHPHVMDHGHQALDDLGARRIGCNSENAVGLTVLSWLD